MQRNASVMNAPGPTWVTGAGKVLYKLLCSAIYNTRTQRKRKGAAGVITGHVQVTFSVKPSVHRKSKFSDVDCRPRGEGMVQTLLVY